MTGPALSRSDVARFCSSFQMRARGIARHLADAEKACTDAEVISHIEDAAQQVGVLASELAWLQSEVKARPDAD